MREASPTCRREGERSELHSASRWRSLTLVANTQYRVRYLTESSYFARGFELREIPEIRPASQPMEHCVWFSTNGCRRSYFNGLRYLTHSGTRGYLFGLVCQDFISYLWACLQNACKASGFGYFYFLM